MLPNFAAVREGRTSYADLTRDLTPADLPNLLGELYDTIESIVGDATDQAVTFVPRDPHLEDETKEAYTLGHVIVHLTAGCEETSMLGLTLARGVPVEGRSRYETPWETMKTAAQLRQRLVESRRMCLSMRGAWPDEPHLDLTHTIIPQFGPLTAVGVTLMGPFHADNHLEQLRETMRQAGNL